VNIFDQPQLNDTYFNKKMLTFKAKAKKCCLFHQLVSKLIKANTYNISKFITNPKQAREGKVL
jgi:hypothetical protein